VTDGAVELALVGAGTADAVAVLRDAAAAAEAVCAGYVGRDQDVT
jgi:hypothetical protein